MQKQGWEDLEPFQGKIAGNFERPLEEAGGNWLSGCLGAPGELCQAVGVWSSSRAELGTLQ